MATAKPFTWTVRLTVAPLWVADGFTMTDERAREMLSAALQSANGDELDAVVLEAPSPQHILRIQGYTSQHHGYTRVNAEIASGTQNAGKLRAALTAARKLLDSVAFVEKEGDTAPVIAKLDAALLAIDARQGEVVEVDL